MDLMASKLCDIQGRLFELSVIKGYDSDQFVSFFMSSNTAKYLDSKYNRMQWAGEEYLLEEILEEAGEKISKSETPYDINAMYWIGYIYRYWHYYKGESSKKIYQIANFKTMKQNYMIFHTFAPELAIEDLIEIKQQKENR